MAETKTKATMASVARFIAAVGDPRRRDDAEAVCAMMERLSGEPPRMWGPSIVGFGSYHYRYDSGHEGDMCRIGFSPRKAQLVLYIAGGFPRYEDLLGRLGKNSTGKGCLYIKKLAHIDEAALEELVTGSLAYMEEAYPPD